MESEQQQSPSFYKRSIIRHKELHGKSKIASEIPVQISKDLSLAYVPGVVGPCRLIAHAPDLVHELALKRNTVAVVIDGSAVLWLGNIGPEVAVLVREGKALLFREFDKMDAWPICLTTQEPDVINNAVRNIAPVFGGADLDGISAPRCFEIENRLQDLGIPIFHGDQHGTAIVLLAVLLIAWQATGRQPARLKGIVNGADAAGTAIARQIRCIGEESATCVSVEDVIGCDSKGAIHRDRDDLSSHNREILEFTNPENRSGPLLDVLEDANAFIGVNKGWFWKPNDIQTIPEILPDEAMAGDAVGVGTGRSDFLNQVNNLLAFPGISRGALDARACQITQSMKFAAA